MLRLASALESSGLDVVRFNFDYVDKGTRRIDPMPVLKKRFEFEVDQARRDRPDGKIIIGGRSMGGRVASLLAAEGFSCDGLLLAAYPLHPAGKPEMLRDAHLPNIRCPVLFLSGTRDLLCTRALMEASLAKLKAPVEMHWLEGADHSFHVLKSAGRSDADVLAEAGAAIAKWVRSYPF